MERDENQECMGETSTIGEFKNMLEGVQQALNVSCCSNLDVNPDQTG